MELKKLFIGMMACAAVAACTNDEFVEEKGNEVLNADSYIAINIVSPSSSATRAANTGFEDGTGNENIVKSAIFFFFDANGNGCAAPATPTLTFPDNSGNGNFEKISNAIIVLENPTTIPSQIIAILNPTTDVAALDKNATLTDLREKIENYSTTLSENGFMMSNSVYLDANKEIVDATALPAGSVCKTQELAKASPVMIPVERVVAKVTTNLNNQSSTGTYIIDNKEYTLKTELLGWLVTNLNPSSNLLKKIDPAFNGFANWNDAANFRSYWGISSTPTHYKFFKYSDIAAQQSNTTVYCLENTLKNAADSTTKVIVAGKIVATPVGGGTEQSIDLMEWRGAKYTSDGLAIMIANLSELKQYYTMETGSANNVYTSISKDALKFVPVTGGQMFSTVTLNDPAIELYKFDTNESKYVKVENSEVIKVLSDLGNIKHWKDGMTYFYTDIKHLSDKSAVIRNHSYKLTINAVKGLGTPVPDSDVVIIPQKPGNDGSYIAAKVEILNWRIVNQTVDLN